LSEIEPSSGSTISHYFLKDGGLCQEEKAGARHRFFWFCIRTGWIAANPTLNLKRITVHQRPTDYFPREEYARIVEATYQLDDGRDRAYDIEKRGKRIRALGR
jgi:integrase/recombinase XerD